MTGEDQGLCGQGEQAVDHRIVDAAGVAIVVGLQRAAAEGQRVASHIELVIKVAFITVYRYRQDGEDEWRRDVLARTRIDTDDNGTTSHVAFV